MCASRSRACRAATRLPSKHQSFGDGVAREPIGAVSASDRFACHQESSYLGFHLRVGSDAAHVVLRDRRVGGLVVATLLAICGFSLSA